MRRAAILVVAFCLVGLLSTGCSGGGGDGPDLSSKQPDFTLTSVALSEEVKKNDTAATEKYKGKVIEITGKVVGAGKNASKDPFLRLEGAKGDIMGVMVFTQDKAPWGKATPGQTVTIKGNWPEIAFGASLINGHIVKVEGEKAPTLTAAELAKEYEGNREETTKKYDEKFLILKGEIESKEANEAGAVTLIFKTPESKVKVKCSFTAFDKEETEKLNEGQTVTVLGQYTLNLDESEVGLYFCILMEGE